MPCSAFYTLSALSIDLASLPDELSRKLPRHPVPCALIGRLAIDRSAQGRGIGRLLLADAIKRVVAAGETVAMHALIVDAANDDAKRLGPIEESHNPDRLPSPRLSATSAPGCKTDDGGLSQVALNTASVWN